MPHNRPLVLLVDNHEDTRDMYAEYLRACGFRVIACSDSRTSIDFARSCRPNIIFLELRMTGMNGAEVLARLREEPSLARVPVVALTASVMSFERDAAMAAGFNEVLAKPCFPEDLASAITRIIGATATAPSAKPLNILRGARRVVSPRRGAAHEPAVLTAAQSPR
jgi:CheY-like chemotaxis protein